MTAAGSLTEATTPPGDGSSPPSATEPAARNAPSGTSRLWLFVVVAIVIVIVVAGAAVYAIYHGSHSSNGGTGTLLARAGSNYTITPGQYNAITFVTKSDGSVNGTIYEASGLVIYLMTPEELQHLAIFGNISGYSWTSGRLSNFTEYDLSIPVTPDAWDVVFLNPNAVVTELTSYLDYVTNIELVS